MKQLLLLILLVTISDCKPGTWKSEQTGLKDDFYHYKDSIDNNDSLKLIKN